MAMLTPTLALSARSSQAGPLVVAPHSDARSVIRAAETRSLYPGAAQ
ncbi:hypothetical protein OH782_42000 (plasmid) [Streptomyces sp. NBC_01544]